MLIYGRGILPATSQWCAVVLLEEGLAWRPMSDFWAMAPFILAKTGYQFIPLAAISNVSLKHGAFFHTKRLQITWRDANNESRLFEVDMESARFWLPKLAMLGLEVVGAELADSRYALGLFYNYGYIVWFVGLFVTIGVTFVVSERGRGGDNAMVCGCRGLCLDLYIHTRVQIAIVDDPVREYSTPFWMQCSMGYWST